MTDLHVPHAPREGLAIGEAAEACGISVDALRYYEKENLLLAPAARNSGGHRTPGTETDRLRLLEEHRQRVVSERHRVAVHLAAIDTKIAWRASSSLVMSSWMTVMPLRPPALISRWTSARLPRTPA